MCASAPNARHGLRSPAPLALALLLAVCARARSATPAATPTPARASAAELGRPPADSSGLALRLDMPAEVRAGRRVPFRLVLINAGRRTVPVNFGGSPTTFDVIVTAPGGAVVWERLYGRMWTNVEIIGPRFAPGDSLAFEDGWDQRDNAGRPVAPGTYAVRAWLAAYEWVQYAQKRPLTTQPRPLTITP